MTAENGVANPSFVGDDPANNLEQRRKTIGFVNKNLEITEIVAEEIVRVH
jgi:hypothetical protein